MQKIWKKETVFSWWQQPSTQHKRHSHPAQPQQPGIRRGIITASFTPQKKLDRQELRRPGKQNTKRSSIVRRPTTGIPHTYPRPRISLLVKTLFREPLLSVSSATRTLPCSHAPVSFRNSFFFLLGSCYSPFALPFAQSSGQGAGCARSRKPRHSCQLSMTLAQPKIRPSTIPGPLTPGTH